MPAPRIGDFFEDYYLMALLGEGGMSEVFLAYDLLDPKLVALKFLLGVMAESPRTVARMRREGRIYRSLRHPSIVHVLREGSTPEVPIYLVLEVIRGRALDEVLREAAGPLPVPRAVRVLEDTASALQTAHRQGIVHRDVKPQNILVDADDRATLLDFGIAHAEDEHADEISEGTAGTLVYAAPEQRRGEEPDARGDVYGLGAVLYEMITGRPVLRPASYEEMVTFSTATLPPPSAGNPAVPPVLDAMCMKLLADRPEERYPSLRAVLVELGMLRIELPEAERAALFGPREERALDEATKALRDGEYEKGEGIARELARDPSPELAAEVFHLLGRLQDRTGQPGEALHSFRRALEHEPGRVDAAVDRILLLLRIGKLDEARQALLSAAHEVRDHPLVVGLAELLRALPEVPPPLAARFTGSGTARQFHRAVRGLLDEAAGSVG